MKAAMVLEQEFYMHKRESYIGIVFSFLSL